MPTQPTASYMASWEYVVDGKIHRYTHTQSSPAYAAMAQKERELISARTKAAPAAAKARGAVLGGDRGYRPTTGPDAAAAAEGRRQGAERPAHRLSLEVQVLRAEGIVSHAGMARALSERQVTTPRGSLAWTHTTIARILARAG